MDEHDWSVVDFLTALQSAQFHLALLWQEWKRAGASVGDRFSSLRGLCPAVIGEMYGKEKSKTRLLAAGAIELGFSVERPAMRPLFFSVEVMWGVSGWTVRASAYDCLNDGSVEMEDEREVIRAVPGRAAGDIGECIRHLAATVKDLAGFRDIAIPRRPEP